MPFLFELAVLTVRGYIGQYEFIRGETVGPCGNIQVSMNS